MFSYRILPVGANFINKPRLLPAFKNASDQLELSISVGPKGHVVKIGY